jgi:uncharacterized protein YjbI with pentapeptide repeats
VGAPVSGCAGCAGRFAIRSRVAAEDRAAPATAASLGRCAQAGQPSMTGRIIKPKDLRELSAAAVKEIVAKHHDWVKSNRSEGERADLSSANLARRSDLRGVELQGGDLVGACLRGANLAGADLSGASLEDCDLQEANLQGARLREAKLTGADLRRADLAHVGLIGADLAGSELRGCTLLGADLTDAANLTTEQLAGTDLSGAKVSQDLAEFPELDRVAEVSKNTQRIFVSLLGACAYVALAVISTLDAELLANTAAIELPIVKSKVPIILFYWVTPALLVLFYAYFHLVFCEELWSGLAGLPALLPDGKLVQKKTYSWLYDDFVCTHISRLRGRRSPFCFGQVPVFIGLAWGGVPATILLFWWRYLSRHDRAGTWFHAALVVLSIVLALLLLDRAAMTLRTGQTCMCPWSRVCKDVGGVIITSGSIGAFLLVWHISMNSVDGRLPFAQAKLHSAKLEGANLRNAHLQGSDLWHANLRSADLENADLRRAVLVGADFRNAILSGADLREANLREAALSEQRLSRVDLTNADLFGALLKGAKLRAARLSGADLRLADLRQADLTGAVCDSIHNPAGDITNRTNFRRADLTGAYLDRAHLDSVDLSTAILTGASLTGAVLRAATLPQGISLKGTNLASADLQGADLVGVCLDGAQLDSANLLDVEIGEIDRLDTWQRGNNWLLAHYKLSDTLVRLKLKRNHNDLIRAKDLRKYNLAYRRLRGTRLHRFNLAGADLREADLTGADLSGVDLTGAKLAGAMLADADLLGAKVRQVKISNDQLQQARNWLQASYDTALLRQLGLPLDLDRRIRNRDLHGLRSLRRARLVEANLASFDLSSAELKGADLQNARLRGSNLTDTNLAGANLSGADLSQVIGLERANLAGARCDEATKWPYGFNAEKHRELERDYEVSLTLTH